MTFEYTNTMSTVILHEDEVIYLLNKELRTLNSVTTGLFIFAVNVLSMANPDKKMMEIIQVVDRVAKEVARRELGKKDITSESIIQVEDMLENEGYESNALATLVIYTLAQHIIARGIIEAITKTTEEIVSLIRRDEVDDTDRETQGT